MAKTIQVVTFLSATDIRKLDKLKKKYRRSRQSIATEMVVNALNKENCDE